MGYICPYCGEGLPRTRSVLARSSMMSWMIFVPAALRSGSRTGGAVS